MVRNDEIRQRLQQLGEDSRWEFKRVEFRNGKPTSPTRDELVKELIAFANAKGGTLLLGVEDDGSLQGMSREQMAAIDKLMAEASSQSIEPALRIDIHHRQLDGKAFVVIEVPRGDSLHERRGRSWIRVGESTRPMTADERLRLGQRRGQNRYVWFDEQPVPATGFDTLDPALWKPMLSTEGAADPAAALAKLALLAPDESGQERATVAGVLLCTPNPEQWLPNAAITATFYRGTDRTAYQLDAREIVGPLQQQIADAMKFVAGNMRVAARKVPARIDMPAYSIRAVFEAVVNAVVHRDYANRASRIRLSMFVDRLEIRSPGGLPNTLTIESMGSRQATRNQAIASLMGRIGVGEIHGSTDRRYFMERRGDGVPIIKRETREVSGRPPQYSLDDDAEVVLVIPAAPLDGEATRTNVTVRTEGQPLPGADVLALFPNYTWAQAVADDNGEATIDLYTADLPMTVFCAAPGYAACLARDWLPAGGALALELTALPQGGSAIYADGTGHLPGLRGRLNPQRDALDRTYLYADNISINDGTQQPVHFVPGEDLRLTDNWGYELVVRIVAISGRAALVEYRAPNP